VDPEDVKGNNGL